MAGSFRGCLGDGQRPGIHLRRGMLLARPRGLHMEPLVFEKHMFFVETPGVFSACL